MDWVNELSALTSSSSSTDIDLPKDWAETVLAFWFDELEPADWFTKSDATDAKIGERFLKFYKNISGIPAGELFGSARRSLAAVIVLDQFPRNLFRGNGLSFATDAKALEIAEAAVNAGLDRDLSLNQRVFLYLPFEHSEDMSDQVKSVALISSLGNEEYTRYAIAHREVIERFRRFPHRNKVLERVSTKDEQSYLAQPGSGF